MASTKQELIRKITKATPLSRDGTWKNVFEYLTNSANMTPESVTYAELKSLKDAEQLEPFAWYIINDFQTYHIKPNSGDRSESWSNEENAWVWSGGETHIGPVEPLLVQASSKYSIFSEVYSIDNPWDTIYYDINPYGWVSYFSNVNIPYYIPSGNKGFIYYRRMNGDGFKFANFDLRNADLNGADTFSAQWGDNGVMKKASGMGSHAEGEGTVAKSDYSHAEGQTTVASAQSAHAEGYFTTASGSESHAEGSNTESSNQQAHAEGRSTVASGQKSHAEGNNTEASGSESHAEGRNTVASEQQSHAEGYETEASADQAHSEGNSTTASAESSHAEGKNTEATAKKAHAEGGNTKASQKNSHAEGKDTVASGLQSHAEGNNTEASNNSAHAEGRNSVASNSQAHAEGNNTEASHSATHAEGSNTEATKQYAHAEGTDSTASGLASHAQGNATTASGESSHSEGDYTTASAQFSHAQGIATTAAHKASHAGGRGGKTEGKHDFIHSGDNSDWDSSTSNNLFRVNGDGTNGSVGDVTADGSFSGGGADYAEMFEWKDGNSNEEDRVGYFVSLTGGDKIQVDGSNPIGVVSAQPAVLGDASYMKWKHIFVTDDFGRVQRDTYQKAEFEQKVNDDSDKEDSSSEDDSSDKTETVIVFKDQNGKLFSSIPEPADPTSSEYTGEIPDDVEWEEIKVKKINSNYDPSKEYTNRVARTEWDAIGLVGKLLVREDNTASAGDQIKPKSDGTATKADPANDTPTYHVLRRISDSVVEILFK